MGHLSTSERVDATTVTSNVNCHQMNGNLSNGNIKAYDPLVDGCPKVTKASNGNLLNKDDDDDQVPIRGCFSDTENFIAPSVNDQNNNDVKSKIGKISSEDLIDEEELKKLAFTADHRNKTDLNVYTEDFRGDSILGIWKFNAPLKWDKIIQITALHLAFIYGFFTYDLEVHDYRTSLWSFVTGGIAGLGVTGGAHRLWTHRSYKANTILRSILMCCFSLAGQNTLFDWVRDHRVHHKYSETDADPHNSNRGFFFAHVGWLMMHKHPDVIKRGRQIDMSDVLNDPVVQFHQKYFIPLKIMLCFVLPTLVPVYFWGESWYYAILQQCVFRYVCSLNFTWSVNSAAHMWGYRPYDRRINPSENRIVSVVAMGEGWHNYHHVFPWDYKAAELGNYRMNLTTMWLDIFAKLGWAWDMKQPSEELVRRTTEKYGDDTHPVYGHKSDDHHHHIEEVPSPKDDDTTNLIIYNKKVH